MFVPPAIVNPILTRDIIDQLGLQSGLKLCLDAGDALSYTSGQSWLDRSGGGYDFFLGATSGSEASDPTFNGVAGAASSAEYFSFDGGDFFTYDTSNETWMEELHKDSAFVAMASWFYLPASTAQTFWIFSNEDTSSTPYHPRFIFGVATFSNRLRVIQMGDSGAPPTQAETTTPTNSLNHLEWVFGGFTLDEAASSIVFQINGTQYTNSYSFTAPSNNSGGGYRIGSMGDAVAPALAGTRLAQLAIWQGTVPTTTQLDAYFQATRGRFGV